MVAVRCQIAAASACADVGAAGAFATGGGATEGAAADATGDGAASGAPAEGDVALTGEAARMYSGAGAAGGGCIVSPSGPSSELARASVEGAASGNGSRTKFGR